MVRPVSFTGYDIFQAIAIDVSELDGVEFREVDTVGVFGGFATHDQVFGEFALSVGT